MLYLSVMHQIICLDLGTNRKLEIQILILDELRKRRCWSGPTRRSADPREKSMVRRLSWFGIIGILCNVGRAGGGAALFSASKRDRYQLPSKHLNLNPWTWWWCVRVWIINFVCFKVGSSSSVKTAKSEGIFIYFMYTCMYESILFVFLWIDSSVIYVSLNELPLFRYKYNKGRTVKWPFTRCYAG